MLKKARLPRPANQHENAQGKYIKVLETLKADPGEWYKVHADAGDYYTGRKAMVGRGAEVVGRSNGDGTYRIYAKWPEED